MTVSYTRHVATVRGFGVFWKLLFRWRGSIYKLVWPDLVLYSVLYYILRFLYDFALNEDQRRVFEKICLHCQDFVDLIPVAFVLGFYVNMVMTRWWGQYQMLPWPDSLAVFVSTSIQGQDDRGRLMRRTIMRYVNLSFTITLAMISPQVKKRFPTLEHLVEAGFLTENEKLVFEHLNEKYSHPKYWMPLVWAGSIVTRARKEGRIRDDFAVKTLLDAINQFRSGCGGLLSYDTISVPLVYTQVVTLAVYSFFLGSLFARQFLDASQKYAKNYIDLYVPWFTLLQFFFYMGWLKVAESLVNPFGEDDDDFEVNWLIDRNLQVSFLIVDEMHSEHPEMIQDLYWDQVFPQELPYTKAAEEYKTEPPQGSASDVVVPEHEQEFLPIVEEEDEVTDDRESATIIPIDNQRTVSAKGSENTDGRNALGSRPTSSMSKRQSTSFFETLLSKILPSSSSACSKPASRRSSLRRSSKASVRQRSASRQSSVTPSRTCNVREGMLAKDLPSSSVLELTVPEDENQTPLTRGE